MNIAVDENGNRILPYKNGRAKCPNCDGVLIAHCGDIKMHHWQHETLSVHCDTWKENETQWHRDWKNKYPIDFQEVIIKKAGKIHRADICNTQGLVIEFQNSNISPTEIKERENFYENMIWVVNAQKFIKNIEMASLVTRNTRYINSELECEKKHLEREYEDDIEEEKKNIKELEKILSELNKNKKSIETKLEYHKFFFENIDSEIDKVICFWETNNYNHISWIISETINDILEIFKDKYLEYYKNIRQCKNSIITNNYKVSYIDKMPIYREYKEIKIEDIQDFYFSEVKIVEKNTKTEFFPVILNLSEKTSFQNLKFQKNAYNSKYDFLMDFSNQLSNLRSSITTSQAKINELVLCIYNLKNDLKKGLCQRINEKYKKYKLEWKNIVNEIFEIENKLEVEKEYFINKELYLNSELVKKVNSLYNSFREEEVNIQKKYKGCYSFTWKHERKSWQFSKKTIYFDIGKDYLFKLVDDCFLKKVNIEDFLRETNL